MHACEGEAVCKLTNAKVRRETLERTPPAFASRRARNRARSQRGFVRFASLPVRVFLTNLVATVLATVSRSGALLQRPHIPGEQDPGGKGGGDLRPDQRLDVHDQDGGGHRRHLVRERRRVSHLARQAAAHGALLAAEGGRRRRPRRRRPRPRRQRRRPRRWPRRRPRRWPRRLRGRPRRRPRRLRGRSGRRPRVRRRARTRPRVNQQNGDERRSAAADLTGAISLRRTRRQAPRALTRQTTFVCLTVPCKKSHDIIHARANRVDSPRSRVRKGDFILSHTTQEECLRPRYYTAQPTEFHNN